MANSMNKDMIYWRALRDVYLKQRGTGELYQPNSRIAPGLIVFFYNLFPHPYFNMGLETFKNKYIANENEIEHLGDNGEHTKVELKGMSEMYKYIEHYEFEEEFTIFELMELHRKLFSHSPFPENAGKFRETQAIITGNGVEPSLPENLISDFFALSDEFDTITKMPINTNEDITNYIKSSVILTTKLIKIHPFVDGNGRSIRGLLNLMFKKANIPPVYVVPEERGAYISALNKALVDNEYNKSDFSDIVWFYYYKICDSLIEITDGMSKKQNEPDEFDGEGVRIYKGK